MNREAKVAVPYSFPQRVRFKSPVRAASVQAVEAEPEARTKGAVEVEVVAPFC